MDITQQPYKHLKLDKFVYGSKQKVIKTTTQVVNKDENLILNYKGNKKNVYYFSDLDDNLINFHLVNFDYVNNKKNNITINSYIDNYNPTFATSANIIKHYTTLLDGQRIAYFPQYIYTPLDIAQFKNSCYLLLPISTNKFVNIAHPNKILNDILKFDTNPVPETISSYIEPHKQFFDRAAYTPEDNSIPVYDMNFNLLQSIKFSSTNDLYIWLLKWGLQSVIYEDSEGLYHSLINEMLFDSVRNMSFEELSNKNLPIDSCDSVKLEPLINFFMTKKYLYSRLTINKILSELFANLATTSMLRYFKLAGRINELNSDIKTVSGLVYTNISSNLIEEGIYNTRDLLTKEQDVTFTPYVLPQNTLLIDSTLDSLVYDREKPEKLYFPSCYINFINLKNSRDPLYQLNCTLWGENDIKVENDIFLNDYRFSISANNMINTSSCLSCMNEQMTVNIVNKAIEYDNNSAENTELTGYVSLFPQRMSVKRNHYINQYNDKHICNNKLSSMGTLNGLRNYLHTGTSFSKNVWLSYKYNEVKQYANITYEDKFSLKINDILYDLNYLVDDNDNITELYLMDGNVKYILKYDKICDKLYLVKKGDNIDLIRVDNNHYCVVNYNADDNDTYQLYYNTISGQYYYKDKNDNDCIVDQTQTSYLSTELNTILTNLNNIIIGLENNLNLEQICSFGIGYSENTSPIYYKKSAVLSSYKYKIKNNIIDLTNLKISLYKNDEEILTTNKIRQSIPINNIHLDENNYMVFNNGEKLQVTYKKFSLTFSGFILTNTETTLYSYITDDIVSAYYKNNDNSMYVPYFSTYWIEEDEQRNPVKKFYTRTNIDAVGLLVTTTDKPLLLFNKDENGNTTIESILIWDTNINSYKKIKFTPIYYISNNVITDLLPINKISNLIGITNRFNNDNYKTYSLPFLSYSLDRDSQWIKDYNGDNKKTCIMKPYGITCPWGEKIQEMIGCTLGEGKQCSGFCTFPCNGQIKQSFNDNKGLNWKLSLYNKLNEGVLSIKESMNNGLNLASNNLWFIIPSSEFEQLIVANDDILINDDLLVFITSSTIKSSIQFSDLVSDIPLSTELKSIFQGFWNKGDYKEFRYSDSKYSVALNSKFNGPHIITKDTIITGISLDDPSITFNYIPPSCYCLMRVKSWWSDTIKCEGSIKVIQKITNNSSITNLLNNYDFVETVDGFFKFKQTGLHKSNIYSINLKNTGLGKNDDKVVKYYTKSEAINLLELKYFIRYYLDEDSFLVSNDENTFIHAVFDSEDNTTFKRTPLFKNLEQNNLSGFILNYITIPFLDLILYEGMVRKETEELYYYKKEYQEAYEYNSLRLNIRLLIEQAIRKSITRYMPADTNLWKVEYLDEK